MIKRTCPACSADQSTTEMASATTAESLGYEELRPHWSGLFKEKLFFSYARCADCGLLYAPLFFSGKELGDLYAEMAPNMEDVPGPALEATQRGYWESARDAGAAGGGYLEIGPDIGYIVRHAARSGGFERFWLFEPNRAVHGELAAACEGKQHDISVDMDNLSAVPDGSIGLAVMIHVLDHLLDPLSMLKQIRQKLKPGGILMIVTHNERSLLRRLMGVKFPPFCLQHPALFNPQSISGLLARVDYSHIDVGRSKNYFPIAFMARQAAWTVGINIEKLPLPKASLGLKLGNMITIARG